MPVVRSRSSDPTGQDVTEAIEDVDRRDQQHGTSVVEADENVATSLAQPGRHLQPAAIVDLGDPAVIQVRSDDEGEVLPAHPPRPVPECSDGLPAETEAATGIEPANGPCPSSRRRVTGQIGERSEDK